MFFHLINLRFSLLESIRYHLFLYTSSFACQKVKACQNWTVILLAVWSVFGWISVKTFTSRFIEENDGGGHFGSLRFFCSECEWLWLLIGKNCSIFC